MSLAIGKIGTIIWKVTGSQAVGSVQAEGVRDAVLGDGGEPTGRRGHETVPAAKVETIGPYVFLWAGIDYGCLRNHSGAARRETLEGNRRFYTFTDFRGKPARNGRGRR